MGQSGSRSSLDWLLAGYAGLAGFFVLEAVVRRPGDPSSLRAQDDDRGTTRALVIFYAVAASLPPLTRGIRTRRLPMGAALAGVASQGAGLTTRAWAMSALGGSYSRTLRTPGGQLALVDTGPYRWVRHPGYLGSLLTWAGFALTSRDPLVVVVLPVLLGLVYRRRIIAEERLLTRDVPGYAAYRQRTRGLIPAIW